MADARSNASAPHPLAGVRVDGLTFERVAFAATVLVAAATFWLSPRLPMTDLAQHAGQVTAWRDLLLGTSKWEPLLTVNYFTPYLLGYGLALLASFVLPISAAIKLVLALGYCGFVAACVALRRHLGGEPRLDWLTIPAFFGFAWAWGFYTFLIAAPFGVLLVLVALRYAERPTLARGRRAVRVRPSAVLLARAGVPVRQPDRQRVPAREVSDAGPAVARGAALRGGWPVVRRLRPGSPALRDQCRRRSDDDPLGLGSHAARFPAVRPELAGRDARSRRLVHAAAGAHARFTAGVARQAQSTGCRRVRSVGHYRWSSGWRFPTDGSTAGRSTSALPFSCCRSTPSSFAHPTRLRSVLPCGLARRLWLPLLCWIYLGMHAQRLLAFAHESAPFEEVLAAAEPGERALGLVFTASSETGHRDAYWHFPLWYQAEKGGLRRLQRRGLGRSRRALPAGSRTGGVRRRFRTSCGDPPRSSTGTGTRWRCTVTSSFAATGRCRKAYFPSGQCAPVLRKSAGDWSLFENVNCYTPAVVRARRS